MLILKYMYVLGKIMNLGEKLAANLQKTKEELLKIENLKKEKDNFKIKQKRDSFREYFSSILENFEKEIDSGIVPKNIAFRNLGRNNDFMSEITYSLNAENFLKSINKSIFSDIYEDVVVAWEKKNNISLTFQDQHDGVGMHSWLEINLRPSHIPQEVVVKNLGKPLKR